MWCTAQFHLLWYHVEHPIDLSLNIHFLILVLIEMALRHPLRYIQEKKTKHTTAILEQLMCGNWFANSINQIFLYRGKNKSKLNQKSGRQGNLNGVEKGKIKNKLNEVVKKGRTCFVFFFKYPTLSSKLNKERNGLHWKRTNRDPDIF